MLVVVAAEVADEQQAEILDNHLALHVLVECLNEVLENILNLAVGFLEKQVYGLNYLLPFIN